MPPRLVPRDGCADGPQDLVDRPIPAAGRGAAARRAPDVLARRAAPRPHDDVRRGRADLALSIQRGGDSAAGARAGPRGPPCPAGSAPAPRATVREAAAAAARARRRRGGAAATAAAPTGPSASFLWGGPPSEYRGPVRPRVGSPPAAAGLMSASALSSSPTAASRVGADAEPREPHEHARKRARASRALAASSHKGLPRTSKERSAALQLSGLKAATLLISLSRRSNEDNLERPQRPSAALQVVLLEEQRLEIHERSQTGAQLSRPLSARFRVLSFFNDDREDGVASALIYYPRGRGRRCD